MSSTNSKQRNIFSDHILGRKITQLFVLIAHLIKIGWKIRFMEKITEKPEFFKQLIGLKLQKNDWNEIIKKMLPNQGDNKKNDSIFLSP